MLKLAVVGLLCLWPVESGPAKEPDNPVARLLNNYEPDIEPYEDRRRAAKPIFNYRKNGVKIDVRVVPAVNDSVGDAEDRFPEFPAQELGRCIYDLSIACFRDRMARFIDAIGRLDEINLYGSGIKLVKTRAPRKHGDRRMLDADDSSKIDRSIDDFFDSFALRISMPRANGKRERNQIDVMFDDKDVAEGRGKKGGGGGGGGKCKKMMMMMLMMGKMKLMAWAGMMSMKGMMMAGMSLMISKAMLIMKLMSLKMKGGGGGGGGGGYGGGGGGGQLKEIVLLTKAPGGGGGGCGDNCGPPPSTSYGPPSGGGGGYDYSGGGGGGWGRSFDNRLPMLTGNSDQPEVASIVTASGAANNPIAENRSYNFTDGTIWESPNNWNSTDNLELNSGKNTSNVVGSYNPSYDEFQALREIPQKTEVKRPKVVRAIYAKKWRNYEATDRILDPGTPMVAVRTSRQGRSRKSIPIAA